MTDITTQLFINGELRRAKSGKVIAQVNPATEEIFCEVQSAGPPELENAIDGAQQAFTDSWRDLKPGRRAEIPSSETQIPRKLQIPSSKSVDHAAVFA